MCNVRMLNDVDVEFSRQLSRVESLVERVPQCVINDLLQSSLTESRSELLRLHAEFLGFHREYMQQKVSLFVLVVVFFCFVIVRRFWHATHDCVALYVDIILHRGQF